MQKNFTQELILFPPCPNQFEFFFEVPPRFDDDFVFDGKVLVSHHPLECLSRFRVRPQSLEDAHPRLALDRLPGAGAPRRLSLDDRAAGHEDGAIAAMCLLFMDGALVRADNKRTGGARGRRDRSDVFTAHG